MLWPDPKYLTAMCPGRHSPLSGSVSVVDAVGWPAILKDTASAVTMPETPGPDSGMLATDVSALEKVPTTLTGNGSRSCTWPADTVGLTLLTWSHQPNAD